MPLVLAVDKEWLAGDFRLLIVLTIAASVFQPAAAYANSAAASWWLIGRRMYALTRSAVRSAALARRLQPLAP
eukprot:347701-Chlamydomonas_euryale.AAC.1